MIPISLFEQFIKFGELLLSNPLYLGLFIIFVLLFLFQFLNVKRRNVVVQIFVSVLFLGLMTFVVLGYRESIFIGLDYLIERLVLNLYFPSFIIYMIVILFSYLIFVYTTFHKKFSSIVKKINTGFFTFIQFLFCVFLIIVITEKIDISSRIAMYQSQDLTMVLQMSMILFLLWLLALVVAYYIKLIRKYFTKKEKSES